jgi:outer membrane protein TolC
MHRERGLSWLAVVALGLSACGGSRTEVDHPSALPVTADAAPASPAPALTAAAFVPVPAPDPLAGATLTLDACIRAALRENRGYLNAQSQMNSARFGINIAEAQVFSPRLNASWNVASDAGESGTGRVGVAMTAAGFDIEPYTRFGYSADGTSRITGDPAADYTSAVGVAITRKLFNISEHIRKNLPVSQADRAYFTAANQVALASRRLEYDTTNAFFTVQRFAARLAVRRRAVATTNDFLAAVRDGVDKGFKAPLEAANAEIGANQAQIDLVEDETLYRSACENLNQLLGRPVDAELVIVPVELDGATVAAIADPPLDTDLRLVLSDHETIGNRRLDIENQIDQVRITRDELMPQVTARATAERRWEGTGFYDGDGDGTPDNVAALNLSYTVPLDGWKAERAQLQQARNRLKELQRQLAEDEANLERQVRAVHRRLSQVRRAAELADARVAAERARYAATLRRYQAGAVDNLELTRAQETVDNAEVGLLDARVATVVTRAEYKSLIPVRLAPPTPPDETPADE